MGYETVIGLEVHCELSTTTKLFCGCPNSFGAEPNTNICPVCLGLPGSLPVLNRQAVVLAMRIGEALSCRIGASVFARKNYFYPDMPKDYQISQYDEPINTNGYLEIPSGARIGIIRAHIEEDTGKSTHVGGGGRIHGADHSLVDYNRAGVPLVEIVSAPDLRSGEDARSYVSELRAILVATGASDGRMEEGSIRVDANVSVRPVGEQTYGTRTEVKNLNSLRSLVRAIEAERRRQVALVAEGESVAQETRHWDEDEGRTHPLRSKEEANDYRYFTEPDLVPVVPDEELLGAARATLVVLPAARRRRLAALLSEGGHGDSLGQMSDQLETAIELDLDDLVLATVAAGADARQVLNRVANEAASRPSEARSLDPGAFCALLGLESSGALSATQTKAVLSAMLASGGDPQEIARRLGFEALGSDELEAVVAKVINANPGEWERYLGGDGKIAQFLLGQVMRQTKGRADGKRAAAALAAHREAEGYPTQAT
ncbi:MAG: Asp-tRNA(Asn)/Glu-tRNA(Gln) amidotransferase subunit GatB [Acidimicrobiales bacterium]